MIFYYDRVCKPTICTIVNQFVIDVVNMVEFHFEGGHYKEVRVYFQKIKEHVIYKCSKFSIIILVHLEEANEMNNQNTLNIVYLTIPYT